MFWIQMIALYPFAEVNLTVIMFDEFGNEIRIKIEIVKG